jgi:diguanylate cyclase (GGDEF)-like protein
MGDPGLSRQTRKELAALLADQRVKGDRLLVRLRELRAREGVPAFEAALHLLANLEVDDIEAEKLLSELLEHREAVGQALGRDPGLHVAAIDFLTNFRKLLDSPTVIDASQLEQTERSAMSDPLTTLYNRRYFQSALEIEIRRSLRHTLTLAVLMLDLDFFKSVNDIYGHVFGDQVLRRAGQVVRRAVRESDVACRFGGDEFAVILPETGRLGAFAVADRIRHRVESDFSGVPIDGRMIAMTVSGGLAVFPDDGSDAAGLIECADRALYHSKSRGKNGIVIHHAERRRAIRFPVRPTTRVEIVGDARSDMLAARAVNLSRSGILLESVAGDAPGGAVELTLSDDGESWRVAGRVVRVEARTSQAGEHRFAVAFDRPVPHDMLRRSALYAHRDGSRAGDAA